MIERYSQSITGDGTIKASIGPSSSSIKGAESIGHLLNFSGTNTDAKFVFITAETKEAMKNSENKEKQPEERKYPNLLVMTREICEEMFRIPFPSREPQKEK